MLSQFEDGLHIKELRSTFDIAPEGMLESKRNLLVAECGLGDLLKLSQRERDCLALLREGLTYQSIAIQLQLSPRTVESYLQSAKNKLGLETHADLCHLANLLFQLGLIK